MKAQDKIGKYLTIEEQEKPGVGAIWRAAEMDGPKIVRHVLIDQIDAALSADAGFTDHFMNQSLVTARLEHPNILQKMIALNENGQLASVYEFHEGFTLARVLERCQSDMFPFSIDHALLVVSKLLSALSYAKSKHLTHGFVNPSQIYVTHEGEIKLKGFAYSSALRACSSTRPNLGEKAGRYVPPGVDPLSGDPDRLDIYACGAILFEMLVGEAFNKESGDAAARISNARTDADSEPIPPKIAKMLLASLDPSRPDAYRDIQKMAREMDELLFSGEYSPTTFNLAFFMHSAFREEMEAMSETVKQEKEKTWAAGAGPSPAAPPPKRAAAPPPPKAAAPAAPRVVQPRASTGSKSKLPMILGAVAVLLVVVVISVVMMTRQDNVQVDDDKFQAQLEEERRKGLEEADSMDRQALASLDAENRALKEELRILREQEKQREILRYQEELAKVNQQMEELSRLQEQEQKTKEQQAKLEALQAKNEELLKSEADARKKLQESQEEALREALAESEPAETEDAKAAEAEGIPAMIEATKEAEAKEEAAPELEPSASTPTKPEPEPETPTATVKAKPKMPVEGQIVDLHDELLVRPVVMEGYETLDAPRKAVKLGYVRRDAVISFALKVLVNENGRVDDVVLHRSPIPKSKDDLGMVDKAMRAAKKLRYSEPSKMGVKVKVWTYVLIHFKGR
ncbi:MAG: protein kinase [Acidobacteriota bacterium]|nr:protein kinase [Acidobacteriota bacterium]